MFRFSHDASPPTKAAAERFVAPVRVPRGRERRSAADNAPFCTRLAKSSLSVFIVNKLIGNVSKRALPHILVAHWTRKIFANI